MELTTSKTTLNSAAVKELYDHNPVAKKIIDYVTLHTRDARVIMARDTAKVIDANEKQIYTVLKDLAFKCNAGAPFIGRAKARTRLELIYPVAALEQAAHEGSSFNAGAPARPMPQKRWQGRKAAPAAKRALLPKIAPPAPVVAAPSVLNEVQRTGASGQPPATAGSGYRIKRVIRLLARLNDDEVEWLKHILSDL